MKMKKGVCRFLSFIVSIVMVVSFLVCDVKDIHAGTDFTVTVSGTMGQTEARSMLAMINEFRHSSDAWYWNPDNTTKTVCSGLPDLTYDYNLEKIAMQRAVEIALHFDHTRPNNTLCFTLTYGGTQSYAENIAAGQTSATSAYTAWREDNDMYSGQGHRRAMLSNSYHAVGIGHFYYNGYHYWVQEFGSSNSGAAVTAAEDSAGSSQVVVNTDLVSGTTVLLTSSASNISKTVELNSTTALPTAMPAILMTESWPQRPRPIGGYSVSWSSSDSTVASITGSSYKANKVGTAVLTCNSTLGGEGKLTLTVSGKSLSNAVVTLASDYCEYTGSEVRPQVTSVVLDGVTLLNGTDYTVSYSNNIARGTAKVTITGIGNYSGTVSKNFTIDCSHSSLQYTTYSSASHRVVCSTCSSTRGYENHDFGDYVLTGKVDLGGVYRYTYEKKCSKCGYTTYKYVTAAADYDDLDNTQDNQNNQNSQNNQNNQTDQNNQNNQNSQTDQNNQNNQNDQNADQTVNDTDVSQVSAFVSRMYTVVLGREAEEGGMAYWTGELVDLKMDGAGVAGGFITGQEFKNRGLSKEQYLDVLYRTFFDREGDPDGINYWITQMNNGMSDEEVLSGFVNSREFAAICDRYGIARGTMKPDGTSTYNAGARNYVLRMYTKALGRSGETMGVESWTDQIVQRTALPVTVAKEFFFSQEYLDKHLDDSAYLDTLYETFMGRTADEDGKNYWLYQMNYLGMSREKVLEEFSVSPEFRQIMAGYGL